MSNPSFREFVVRHFGSRINQLVEEYVTNEFDELEIRTPLKDIDSVSCESTDITTVRIYDAGHTALKFEVDVKCEVDVSGYYRGDIESFPYSPWVTVKCKGDLSHTLDKWYVGDVIPYGDATKKKSDLSDTLIPYVSTENYEKYAEAFLGKNYSQALTEPMRIAPLDLAARMNLKVRQHSISKDCSVFGQMYFAPCDAKLFNRQALKYESVHIDAGTIVYDPDVYWLFSNGKVNNTIVHECVHWYLHSKAFFFEKLYDKTITRIGCKVVGDSECGDNESHMFMEIQANALAPRIQMPFNMFKKKAMEFIDLYSTSGSLEIDIIPQVIDALADFFDVSRAAAKVRLSQVGYLDEVRGCLVYMDGHYVKPHTTKRRNRLSSMQTFCISEEDASLLQFTDCDLYKKLKEESYLFVDNHFVRNNPKYVEYNQNDELVLSEYARLNMEECCIIFELVVKTGPRTDYHTLCVLNMDKDSGFVFQIKYPSGCNTETAKTKYEEDALNREYAVLAKMGRTIDTVFGVIKKEYKVNFVKLAKYLGINDRTIRNAFHGESIPEKSTTILICLGLHLPPSISSEVLKVTNNELKPLLFKDDRWFDFVLHYNYQDDINKNREFLNRHGIRI